MRNAIRRLWREPFVRFLFVGALNTAFGYGVYAALVLVGLRREAALLGAYILGVLFNFRTTGVIVFDSRDPRRLVRFVLVYVTIYALNAAVLHGFEALAIGPLLAQAICIPPITVLTFFAMKTLVFRKAA